jgi:hypothetical protein
MIQLAAGTAMGLAFLAGLLAALLAASRLGADAPDARWRARLRNFVFALLGIGASVAGAALRLRGRAPAEVPALVLGLALVVGFVVLCVRTAREPGVDRLTKATVFALPLAMIAAGLWLVLAHRIAARHAPADMWVAGAGLLLGLLPLASASSATAKDETPRDALATVVLGLLLTGAGGALACVGSGNERTLRAVTGATFDLCRDILAIGWHESLDAAAVLGGLVAIIGTLAAVHLAWRVRTGRNPLGALRPISTVAAVALVVVALAAWRLRDVAAGVGDALSAAAQARNPLAITPPAWSGPARPDEDSAEPTISLRGEETLVGGSPAPADWRTAGLDGALGTPAAEDGERPARRVRVQMDPATPLVRLREVTEALARTASVQVSLVVRVPREGRALVLPPSPYLRDVRFDSVVDLAFVEETPPGAAVATIGTAASTIRWTDPDGVSRREGPLEEGLAPAVHTSDGVVAVIADGAGLGQVLADLAAIVRASQGRRGAYSSPLQVTWAAPAGAAARPE